MSDGATDPTPGRAQQSEGLSFTSFLAALAGGATAFGVQFLAFYFLRAKFTRIYAPRTYLVPEKERTPPPPPGLFNWVIPVFKTSNSEFIDKCGLDAYLFLRFLRMLIKIFLPLACIILPILLPLNRYGTSSNADGMDIFGWQHLGPEQYKRTWAHLALAIVVLLWVAYIFFDELRKYVRIRQAYLTSPQHRLRASATTVLVQAIPRKWLTVEALDGLYDVFPGGIRNIWINRNYDELQGKVEERDKLARKLEAAETALIRKAYKKHTKEQQKLDKKKGKRMSRVERKHENERQDKLAEELAENPGMSSGNPHQIAHNIQDAIDGESKHSSRSSSPSPERRGLKLPIPGLGRGLGKVGHEFNKLGHTVAGGIGGVVGGIDKVRKDVDQRLDDLNRGTGFDTLDDQSTYRTDGTPSRAHESREEKGDVSSHREEVAGATQHPGHERDQLHKGAGASESRINRLAAANRTRTGVAPHSLPAAKPNATGLKPPKPPLWKPWQRGQQSFPSPQPHQREDDEFPLTDLTPVSPSGNRASTIHEKTTQEKSIFTEPYDEEMLFAHDEGAKWRDYIERKDRETMRLPIKVPFTDIKIPLFIIGKKVDTIYWCRREVARLNAEIEDDQKNKEYPLMNSAFIQFNHQVAAHMACQSLSHHIPQQMAPRIVEISPDDVIWDNLSISWWARYGRSAIVTVTIAGLVIFWAFPVTFTSTLSQVSYLTEEFHWLAWLEDLPKSVLSIVQGVLPPLFLAILLAVLPIVLRALANFRGAPTGNDVELDTQMYYFGFLFVQVFLVVSIAAGASAVFGEIADNPATVATILGKNLPKASNYFFSYMIIQALTVSAGALMQIGGLISWFIIATIFDSTAREKWSRQIELPSIKWGTFFPVYTNLACIVIGIIYSVISPLILVFNIVTFSLFWIVYRYQTLYVNRFKHDTGGLLFPRAVMQLFTGLYVMELCLIGLFILFVDEHNDPLCYPQAIIMLVIMLLTFIYQLLLRSAFSPLFRYIPITMEDDAVRRDEEFARAQGKRWNLVEGEREGEDLQDILEERERREREEDEQAEEIELKEIEERNRNRKRGTTNVLHVPSSFGSIIPGRSRRKSWADRTGDSRPKDLTGPQSASDIQHPPTPRRSRTRSDKKTDLESQNPVGDMLFSGFHDEIEDLTPDERDKLVQRAFLHQALRAKRPVVWIPRDPLGISEDEIRRSRDGYGKDIWVSNEYTGLDHKGRVHYRRPPPDFSEVDLIQL
ncbi:DUF221-domain-containing protein [Patellaria atrata CBS 101060]|uniref:DUF221-domain-containing protein n=1 Tax=Patellaria atrata CBS 101060 TaxID=1346257 RepID=A0A9P4S8T4_9PEZI|nr:DUF221-domain-containing protein [Patellaria atrata CBS 101060]